MEPSWHQNRIKNRCQLRKAIFQKSCSPSRGGSIFQDLGVEVGRKIRSKIDEKWKPKWNASWDRFLIDFWSILGPKLGRKIDPRGIKIEVKMEVKFDRFLKASWNAIFSAKRRAKRPRGGFKRAPTRKVRAVGRIMEGFIRQNSKDM